ncbi:noncanonical pyrimidine nucleotidase, YjjG family protein [Fulvitalea axinellae]|uniref:Noncanonical pyrimidine nucleotidase, YjjG family protein n=1 Tax=Fulvitalea axinellae TaxID=1182444 RepID=A0AAU9D4T7_9BACT|nr:noncanonical pyrimidine nucleotidase, YjjG family protein [Fulvitalea axinellae]
MPRYKHLFFDLDHTLWDFERNSTETLIFLFEKYDLTRHGFSANDFIASYQRINKEFWSLYNQDKISKEKIRTQRFPKALLELGTPENEIPDNIGDEFLMLCPRKPHVIGNAHGILERLAPHYSLHIITNGFLESQTTKLACSGLGTYFDIMVTSECMGSKKPNRKIFDYALQKANAQPSESIMIGDNLSDDILGAKDAGIDQVYYNPEATNHNEDITFEIKDLSELENIFISQT